MVPALQRSPGADPGGCSEKEAGYGGSHEAIFHYLGLSGEVFHREKVLFYDWPE